MNLQDLGEFRTFPEVSFINKHVGGIETTTVCYMVQNNSLWEQPNSLERALF